ncbi:MAG: hypothetical protein DHS20C16_06400 [Phycisphaerae bacterium]|nr:MAG: hypothetical protein DHS20C16_06400 [Phycisphaerae bacterium]
MNARSQRLRALSTSHIPGTRRHNAGIAKTHAWFIEYERMAEVLIVKDWVTGLKPGGANSLASAWVKIASDGCSA